MGTISVKSERKESYFIINRLQFRYAATYMLVIAVVLVLLNTYPVFSFRNMVFGSKEISIVNNANIISAAMSGLDTLTAEGAQQVLEVVGGSGGYDIVVTSPSGEVLYGGAVWNARDLVTALGGVDVFRAQYSNDDGFVSVASVPVISRGLVIGGVVLRETDRAQALLLKEMQANLASVSVLIAIITMGMSLIFSYLLSMRTNKLLDSIKDVRAGNYGASVRLRGSDELSELAEEFADLTERLRRDEEERRRFVSDASHELKTPIAAIRLLSDSISTAGEMELSTAREFAEDISQQADRLARLSEKLLTLSKQDEGLPADRLPLDLSGEVRYSERLLRPLAQKNAVTFRLELEEGCAVLGTKDEMSLVVFNLLENAVKYNIPGGRVDVRVSRSGEQVLFSVEDTGIGIPDEDKEKVFQRFYRVDKARSRQSGGSGIGLSIVAGAVEAMGGDIWVEDSSLGGSRFAVEFPPAPPETEPDSPENEAPPPS